MVHQVVEVGAAAPDPLAARGLVPRPHGRVPQAPHEGVVLDQHLPDHDDVGGDEGVELQHLGRHGGEGERLPALGGAHQLVAGGPPGVLRAPAVAGAAAGPAEGGAGPAVGPGGRQRGHPGAVEGGGALQLAVEDGAELGPLQEGEAAGDLGLVEEGAGPAHAEVGAEARVGDALLAADAGARRRDEHGRRGEVLPAPVGGGVVPAPAPPCLAPSQRPLPGVLHQVGAAAAGSSAATLLLLLLPEERGARGIPGHGRVSPFRASLSPARRPARRLEKKSSVDRRRVSVVVVVPSPHGQFVVAGISRFAGCGCCCCGFRATPASEP